MKSMLDALNPRPARGCLRNFPNIFRPSCSPKMPSRVAPRAGRGHELFEESKVRLAASRPEIPGFRGGPEMSHDDQGHAQHQNQSHEEFEQREPP